MAIFAVFTPLALLVVLVALGRYEELMLPPMADEPEAPDAADPPLRAEGAIAPRSAQGSGAPHV
jgi:hypothetical protein